MKKYTVLGVLFFVLFVNYVSYAQVITTVAGIMYPGHTGDGGAATLASLYAPVGIAVDTNGNLFISSNGGASVNINKVRKVNAAGIISTFAGIDTVGFSGDGGPATAARLGNPNCIAFDKNGNVYIADLIGNKRVRKVDAAGIITTYAGNGALTPSGDGGPATAAGLGTGTGICMDTAGNLYIAAGNKIRKVDVAGIITTFAGTGIAGYSGDGGPATAAEMYGQGQIAIDKKGNMYIADINGNRIRKINPAGIITTLAGNGVSGYSGDGGPATAAQLAKPCGVFPDKCGNIYIADAYNDRIRVVNGSGIITTFAGSGVQGFSGEGGPATAAQLYHPNFLYLDKEGSVYICDQMNHRVRYIHMDGCKYTAAVPEGADKGMEQLTVYPNPNSGAFSVLLGTAIDEPAHITVTDIAGGVVKELNITSNKETPLRLDIAAGMYFINATTKERRYNAKVVVER